MTAHGTGGKLDQLANWRNQHANRKRHISMTPTQVFINGLSNRQRQVWHKTNSYKRWRKAKNLETTTSIKHAIEQQLGHPIQLKD
jgi:hypothetical protein